MRASSAKSELIFSEGFFPTEGFNVLLTPLYVRVVLIQADIKIVLVSIEMTSLPADEIAALKDIVLRETNADTCWICVTHTFSAPHVMPDFVLRTDDDKKHKRDLQAALYNATRLASADAASSMVNAKMSIGSDECSVCINRDIETVDGWWVGNSGTGATNKTLTAIHIIDDANQTIAVLVHYAVQSSVLDGSMMSTGGKAVSSDLAGTMAAKLEAQIGGTVLFLVGAAGDQAPIGKAKSCKFDQARKLMEYDLQDDGIEICNTLSDQMVIAATCAIQSAKPVASNEVFVQDAAVIVPAKEMKPLHELYPTRIPPYISKGTMETPIFLMGLGDITLVGVQPELNCLTAKEVTDAHPTALIVTMVNGGAKYMADKDSYQRITYEAMNSPFGKGAAEILASKVKEMLASRP
ncbi:MAG: hypothetical protein GX096_00585 [Clostridiales bacterium]|nr:hypothetical protein [Clostridiales bacterium]